MDKGRSVTAGDRAQRPVAFDKRRRGSFRRPAATFAKRIVRVAAAAGALGGGALALTASCSSGGGGHGATADASTSDRETVPSCPAPSPDPDRCSGDDPGFVFFPPLACDPSGREAGTPDATPEAGEAAGADAAGADGGDPCDGLVNTFSVFFTPQACRAFVAAESSGHVASDTSPAAPLFAQPSDGDMLTSDAWSSFVWYQLTRDARRGPVERALDWLEPPAHAYSPLAGDAYVLEFSQGCTEVMRVMVTSAYWTPDSTSWNTLSSLTGPVHIKVYWMRFTADGLSSTPVPSATITITMQNTGGG
jgi:hypothetical protein